MNINQGHLVIIQALRDKKNHENLKILNIRNLSNKQDLIPVNQPQPKSITKIQRIRKYFKSKSLKLLLLFLSNFIFKS